MESTVLLNIVVAQPFTVFKQLASEKESLFIRCNSLFFLNLCLYILNGIAWLNIEGDGIFQISLKGEVAQGGYFCYNLPLKVYINLLG